VDDGVRSQRTIKDVERPDPNAIIEVAKPIVSPVLNTPHGHRCGPSDATKHLETHASPRQSKNRAVRPAVYEASEQGAASPESIRFSEVGHQRAPNVYV